MPNAAVSTVLPSAIYHDLRNRIHELDVAPGAGVGERVEHGQGELRLSPFDALQDRRETQVPAERSKPRAMMTIFFQRFDGLKS